MIAGLLCAAAGLALAGCSGASGSAAGTTSPVAVTTSAAATPTAQAPTPAPSPDPSPTTKKPTPSKTSKPKPTPTMVSGSAHHYVFPLTCRGVSYGHSHHDYPATDMFAPVGCPIVSPVDGVVDEVSTVDRWDPATNLGAYRGGLSFSIVGVDGVRYYGSHLQNIRPDLAVGLAVQPGEVLAEVGQTGDARLSTCHLHFGISPPCPGTEWEVRRGVIYPWPYLDAWRAGRSLSPALAISACTTAHPNACAAAMALPTAADAG